jgi:thiol:disulfide interchange protein DsbC
VKSGLVLIAMMVIVAVACPAAAEIDFSKAVTIGSGPNIVVEFTDPDCPYCRKAAAYFESRPDVTRHVFFYPLVRHPKAREKAQFVLSAADKAKAYHDVMSGRLDSAQLPAAPTEAARLLEQHLDIARKAKINSTPTFMINGRIIEGFELKKIEGALGAKN